MKPATTTRPFEHVTSDCDGPWLAVMADSHDVGPYRAGMQCLKCGAYFPSLYIPPR